MLMMANTVQAISGERISDFILKKKNEVEKKKKRSRREKLPRGSKKSNMFSYAEAALQDLFR